MDNEALGPRPEYGSTAVNFRCIAELKEVWRRFSWHGQAFDPSHEHAMEMILIKIGRIATGNFKADNYDDIIGYATIARKLVEERCLIAQAAPISLSTVNSEAPAKDSSADISASSLPQTSRFPAPVPMPVIPASHRMDDGS